jgi:hypothetical protein
VLDLRSLTIGISLEEIPRPPSAYDSLELKLPLPPTNFGRIDEMIPP